MEIGVHVPQVGPLVSRQVVGEFAKAADEAGFDALWVFDHVVLQKEQQSKYPYSPDGSQIAFIDIFEGLMRMPLYGGPPVRIASVSTAINAKPGCFANIRAPKRTSCHTSAIIFALRLVPSTTGSRSTGLSLRRSSRASSSLSLNSPSVRRYASASLAPPTTNSA